LTDLGHRCDCYSCAI